jgi:hypothetical protein
MVLSPAVAAAAPFLGGMLEMGNRSSRRWERLCVIESGKQELQSSRLESCRGERERLPRSGEWACVMLARQGKSSEGAVSTGGVCLLSLSQQNENRPQLVFHC